MIRVQTAPFDPHAEAAVEQDRRLIGEGHSGLEHRLVLGGEKRELVHVEPDAVAHSVPDLADWLATHG